MIEFVLSVFRYVFLFLLYFFIYQLIKLMFRDLYSENAGHKQRKNNPTAVQYTEIGNVEPLPGAEAGLFIQSSKDPELPKGSVFPLRSGDDINFGRGGQNTIVL
ncbi:MAG: hypothetical protein AAGU75_22670, partial [Bacillota bacterium]